MKLKNKILALAVFSAALSATAGTPTIDVFTAAGGVYQNSLGCVDEIVFEDGNMIIKSEGESDAKIAITDIDVIFVDRMLGVGSINADKDNVNVRIDGGILYAGTEGKIDVVLYNLKGELLLSASADGEASLDISNLQKGIYIVKANNKVMKLTR